MPKSRVQGTKIGTKTVSTQSPVKTRVVTNRPTTSAPSPSITEEDDDEENELPSTSRPAVPSPRPRGVKRPIQPQQPVPGIKTRVTSAPRIIPTTTSAPIVEEKDDEEEEKIDLPAPKQPVQPSSRPSLSGRKVVVRVTTRPSIVETTTQSEIVSSVVTSTPSARRVISKTRIENVPKPQPFSMSRKSSKTSPPKEQPLADENESTTLEPVPAFESTRRSVNPIIQSISVDNEEDANDSELPRSSSTRRTSAAHISSSDLAKFSSRVRYAERTPNRSISRSRSSNSPSRYSSSYSPPLVEPNETSFVEINRIK